MEMKKGTQQYYSAEDSGQYPTSDGWQQTDTITNIYVFQKIPDLLLPFLQQSSSCRTHTYTLPNQKKIEQHITANVSQSTKLHTANKQFQRSASVVMAT